MLLAFPGSVGACRSASHIALQYRLRIVNGPNMNLSKVQEIVFMQYMEVTGIT